MRFSRIFLITTFFTLTSACGKDNSSSADKKGSPFNTSSLVSTPTCPNPAPLDEFPGNWTLATKEELITGEEGTYELMYVKLQVITANSGNRNSASTITEISSNGYASQEVICKDIVNSGELSLTMQAMSKISRKDGSVSEKRNIQFIITKDNATYSAKAYPYSGTFSKDMDTSREELENLKASNITLDSRTYKVSSIGSPDEFEIRFTVTVPDQKGNPGATITWNAAMHYLLKH